VGQSHQVEQHAGARQSHVQDAQQPGATPAGGNLGAPRIGASWMNCEPLANRLTDLVEAVLNAPVRTAELALQERSCRPSDGCPSPSTATTARHHEAGAQDVNTST
jgi:hypothetical protein